MTGQVLLAYYEKSGKADRHVELRVRVLGDDGAFAPPVTVDQTVYVAYASDNDELPGRPVNPEREDRVRRLLRLPGCATPN